MQRPTLDWKGTGRYDWRANWGSDPDSKKAIVIVVFTNNGPKVIPLSEYRASELRRAG